MSQKAGGLGARERAVSRSLAELGEGLCLESHRTGHPRQLWKWDTCELNLQVSRSQWYIFPPRAFLVPMLHVGRPGKGNVSMFGSVGETCSRGWKMTAQ